MKTHINRKQALALASLSLVMLSFQNCTPLGKGFVATPSSDSNSGAGVTTTTVPGNTTTTTTTIPSVTTTTTPGSSSLIEGKNTTPPNLAMPKPGLNIPYTDSVYGTTIARVTDASQVTDQYVPTWVRHEYSRRPAFNSNSTRALMLSSNGWVRLYSVQSNGTMSFVKTLALSGNDEPNWDPTNPNIIYSVGGNGEGLKIYQYDITNDQKTVARDLASFKTLFPTAARAWTKGEGRPSNDNRVWCFQVEDNSYNAVGIVAYNFQTSQILGSLAVTERPDHISTSPLGNYCVPSWDTARGTRAYKTDFSAYTQLHSKSEHSDLQVSKDGKEMYVFTDYVTGNVAMVDMASGTKTNLFELYGPNSSATAIHISGAARSKPGYVLVGFYACSQNYGAQACDNSQWFKDKVVAVELKANPKIYNLAHTHYGDAGYWSETQGVVNSDFTKILFVSTWGSTVENQVASYMISLPANALP